jgi:hypothetical protein
VSTSSFGRTFWSWSDILVGHFGFGRTIWSDVRVDIKRFFFTFLEVNMSNILWSMRICKFFYCSILHICSKYCSSHLSENNLMGVIIYIWQKGVFVFKNLMSTDSKACTSGKVLKREIIVWEKSTDCLIPGSWTQRPLFVKYI